MHPHPIVAPVLLYTPSTLATLSIKQILMKNNQAETITTKTTNTKKIKSVLAICAKAKCVTLVHTSFPVGINFNESLDGLWPLAAVWVWMSPWLQVEAHVTQIFLAPMSARQ